MGNGARDRVPRLNSTGRLACISSGRLFRLHIPLTLLSAGQARACRINQIYQNSRFNACITHADRQ
jgi:hypothetical protein